MVLRLKYADLINRAGSDKVPGRLGRNGSGMRLAWVDMWAGVVARRFKVTLENTRSAQTSPHSEASPQPPHEGTNCYIDRASGH